MADSTGSTARRARRFDALDEVGEVGRSVRLGGPDEPGGGRGRLGGLGFST
ncbi:hypothetical protein AB0C96_21080 [Streptomyces sp. NPDC048506]|uniref:hypothetical protein n=1 Tax=Streptomyces sp. NPDC048506 TaxID=3155028 RepID=UPI0034492332